MSITGSVHVDLSSFVDSGGFLFIAEEEHRHLWVAIGNYEPPPAARLTIGAASRVYWHDTRALLLLAAVGSLIVEGSDARGVKSAVDAIQECRAGMDAAAAGQAAS